MNRRKEKDERSVSWKLQKNIIETKTDKVNKTERHFNISDESKKKNEELTERRKNPLGWEIQNILKEETKIKK